MALPACALAEPAVPGCASGGQVLPGRNDTSADQLLVPLADPAAVDVLAVTAGPGGELEGFGDFKATPLELSSDWDVGVGSGESTWTYDVPVPAAPAGSAPPISVSYSSGSIDGLSSTRNTQAGQAGLGWADFANAFVERRYTPCIEEVDE